jgi:hypothetical protein
MAYDFEAVPSWDTIATLIGAKKTVSPNTGNALIETTKAAFMFPETH